MGGSLWALSHVFRACSYSKTTLEADVPLTPASETPHENTEGLLLQQQPPKLPVIWPAFNNLSDKVPNPRIEVRDLPPEGSPRIARQGSECRGEVTTRIPSLCPRGIGASARRIILPGCAWSSFQHQLSEHRVLHAAYPITYTLILLCQNPLLKEEIKTSLNEAVTLGLLFFGIRT